MAVYSTEAEVVMRIEDWMGSDGNHNVAQKMYDVFWQRGYIEVEWNGIHVKHIPDNVFESVWHQCDKPKKKSKASKKKK